VTAGSCALSPLLVKTGGFHQLPRATSRQADELWAMGYRKCKSSTILWLGAGELIVVPSGNDAVSGPRDPRELKVGEIFTPDPELLRRQRQQKDNEEVNREADRIRAERDADLAKAMRPPRPLGR